MHFGTNHALLLIKPGGTGGNKETQMNAAAENLTKFTPRTYQTGTVETDDTLGVAWMLAPFKRTDGAERCLAIAFGGKRTRPDVYAAYRSVDVATQALAHWVECKRNAAASRKDRNAAKVEARKVNPFMVGDLLHCSWGYEQTNNDFFQVVAVKGKTLTMRAIGASYEETSYMSGRSTPIRDAFKGPEIVKRVQVSVYGGKASYYAKHNDRTLDVSEWNRSYHESSYA